MPMMHLPHICNNTQFAHETKLLQALLLESAKTEILLFIFFFFFNEPATPEISPLSLPDPLPIYADAGARARRLLPERQGASDASRRAHRSEEHTSELQSPCNLVCRLLLENK